MDDLTIPNLLLIAGTGRNSGKTTFACAVISVFSKRYPIVAVKISPHLHETYPGVKPLFTGRDFLVGEETDKTSSKDSSRMLAAGARKSLFVMARDEQLSEAWHCITTQTDQQDLIVCESGGLRNLIVPGLFLIIDNLGNTNREDNMKQHKELGDRRITFDGKQFDFSPQSLAIYNNQWKIT